MSNRIQGTTGIVGLIGYPLKHSKSPHMHNSAMEKLNLDYIYLCFEVEDNQIREGLEALKIINAKGANITFPHKQKVINYLDQISEDAKIIGSVNTITIDSESKKIKGYNTDGKGFIASLKELKVEYRNKKVVVVGVGGAGRAIAIQLAYDGVKEICIKEKDKEKAKEVKDTIEKNISGVKVKLIEDEENLKKELQESSLLINATPFGMKGLENKCIITTSETLNKDVFVYDIVYGSGETKLLKYAKQIGCRSTNGDNMMIWQGAISFKLWFNKEMPQDYVRQELDKLKRR